jgi:hypothetical protein
MPEGELRALILQRKSQIAKGNSRGVSFESFEIIKVALHNGHKGFLRNSRKGKGCKDRFRTREGRYTWNATSGALLVTLDDDMNIASTKP